MKHVYNFILWFQWCGVHPKTMLVPVVVAFLQGNGLLLLQSNGTRMQRISERFSCPPKTLVFPTRIRGPRFAFIGIKPFPTQQKFGYFKKQGRNFEVLFDRDDFSTLALMFIHLITKLTAQRVLKSPSEHLQEGDMTVFYSSLDNCNIC